MQNFGERAGADSSEPLDQSFLIDGTDLIERHKSRAFLEPTPDPPRGGVPPVVIGATTTVRKC